MRRRDKKFELKLPLNKTTIGQRTTDQYQEVTSSEEIAKVLNLPLNMQLNVALKKNGLQPFATITTIRESYQKESFNLDFDEMDFNFSLFEIELIVNSTDEIHDAEKKILTFAEKNSIGNNAVRGKVFEYLARYNPTHYAILVKHGVTKNNQT